VTTTQSTAQQSLPKPAPVREAEPLTFQKPASTPRLFHLSSDVGSSQGGAGRSCEVRWHVRLDVAALRPAHRPISRPGFVITFTRDGLEPARLSPRPGGQPHGGAGHPRVHVTATFVGAGCGQTI
jgi:hypothetical protein